MPDSPTFGRRLADLRRAAGLTQAKLATAAAMHVQNVSELERGTRLPSWALACRLAAALGVSLDQFATVKQEPSA
jgi:transcriptional regulator with XRE-family HTH domain